MGGKGALAVGYFFCRTAGFSFEFVDGLNKKVATSEIALSGFFEGMWVGWWWGGVVVGISLLSTITGRWAIPKNNLAVLLPVFRNKRTRK